MLNIFSRKKAAVLPGTPLVTPDNEIPRYPPFAKGLPAAHTSRIVQTQTELIARIRGALRFNQSEFEDLVLPVIERYAAYVHLLPASESHHHRGAGGLFRHGLEVGFWAAQRAESHQFCVEEFPQNRRENEPRWQFASFLGGLLHDVGKPLSDVAVTDKTGKKEWNPYESSLSEWSQREFIDHYFLRWRDKRNKRHEKFSMMNLDQIMTPRAKSYLNKPGPCIMEALLEAIVGTGAAEVITRIVIWADQESVRRDLVNQRMEVDEYAYGVPVERYIFDALRRLVNITKINEPGAVIWRLKQGVFLVWNQIVPEIHNLIEKDNIPGIPRNPDTLADILIERGFAVPYQESTEIKPARYWRIYPAALKNVPLNCLRLDDLELIFTNEPPVPVSASFKAPQRKEELQRGEVRSAEPSTPQQSISNSTPESSADDFYSWDQIEESPLPEPPPDAHDHRHMEQGRAPAKQAHNPQQNRPGQNKVKLSRVSRMAELPSDVDSQASLNIKALTKNSPEKQVPAETPLQPQRKKKASTEVAGRSLPNSSGKYSPGWSLIKLAIQRTSGGQVLLERLPDGDYGIPYPASARLIGEPREVMNSLSDEDLLRPDQASASKTSVIAGKKYLLLSRKVSRFVAEQLEVTQQGEQPVQPNINPPPETVAKKPDTPAKTRAFTDQITGPKKRKNTESKLPSQEELGYEFIGQIVQGFGPYIAGDVQMQSKEGVSVYQVSIDSIQVMAASLNTTPTVIRMMVRKMPSVKIRINHEKDDYIEFTEER